MHILKRVKVIAVRQKYREDFFVILGTLNVSSRGFLYNILHYFRKEWQIGSAPYLLIRHKLHRIPSKLLNLKKEVIIVIVITIYFKSSTIVYTIF